MTLPRWFPSSLTARIGLVLALLLAVQGSLLAVRSGGDPAREPLIAVTPSASAPAASTPTPTPTRSPATPAAQRRGALFEGFGAWVDTYDYPRLDARAASRAMARAGVDTLYLQTGRYSLTHAIDPAVGRWLEAAHDEGMKVVGWYLPAYDDAARELSRTVAIASYTYKGHRFDGIGLDIEYKGRVRNPVTWNKRVVAHARRVRLGVGADYPVASIVPPPVQMDIAPLRWAGFPWKPLAEVSDAIVLMAYWSFRHTCPEIPVHCPYEYAAESVRRTRVLIGDDAMPIHVAGGEAGRVKASEVAAFLRGVKDSNAQGASLYDYETTSKTQWALMTAHFAK